jgi:L-2,4-diaminobutyric acid acetyltransferase
LNLRAPNRSDGPALQGLVAHCPPLDLNSVYLYLLLAEHFSGTCMVADQEGSLLGMVSAYRPPARADVLFVWQVAVHPQARRRQLGLRMLQALMARPHLADVRWVETTVGPGNQASRRLFAKLAAHLGALLDEEPLFGETAFGDAGHDAEPLLRMGPLDLRAAQVPRTMNRRTHHGLENL